MKSGAYKMTRQALPIVFVFVLAGCSYFDYVFSIFDGDEPAAQTAADQGVRDRSDAQRAASGSSGTPSLASVPKRPEIPKETSRERVVDGLVSDHKNARYTDKAIRLQGTTQASATDQSPSRPSAPAVAPVTPPEAARVVPVQQQTLAARAPKPSSRSTPPAAAVVQPRTNGRAVKVSRNNTRGPITQASGSVIVDLSVLDGGSYVPTSARVVPTSTRVVPNAPVVPNNRVATIQFNKGSDRLSPRDRGIIKTVASAQRVNGANVLVVGHASSRTRQLSKERHEFVNFQISSKRANVVAQALIQSGVASNLVTVEAVSDNQPIYSESMPEGEAGNRRTEIFFLR